MIKLALLTSMGYVLIFFTLTLMLQPLGVSMKMAPNTFWNCSTAAGVIVIMVEGMASPSKAIAKDMASTAPPVGIAM
jgi:hypothetical protein